MCTPPPFVHNGRHFGTGLIVNYGCEAGYGLVGNSTRECQGNGSWTGVAPECIFGKYNSHLVTNIHELYFLFRMRVHLVYKSSPISLLGGFVIVGVDYNAH